MSNTITVITYDTVDEIDSETVIKTYQGIITSASFTNYENGTVICPNGKTMKVEHILVSDDIYNNIGTRDLGNSYCYTISELINSVNTSSFDSATVVECGVLITIDDDSDYLLFKVENYIGIDNEHWNPYIYIRLQADNSIQTPPLTIEIYNEAEELLGSFNSSSNWSDSISTSILHQIAYYKIIYTTTTRNSFIFKIE